MAAWKLWGPGCECCAGCTGTICFTLKECDGTTAIAGATVTISLASVDVGTGTTDASGQCCIGITSAGTYAWRVEKSGYETQTGTIAATCITNNVNVGYEVGKLKVVVFGCVALPSPLSDRVEGATVVVKSGSVVKVTGVTDANGEFTPRLKLSGSYTVEISKSRFVTDTDTLTFGCTTSSHTVFLAIASGYHCDKCADPLPDLLYLTTPAGTSVTMTWSVNAWYGTDSRVIANATNLVDGLYCQVDNDFSTETIVFRWTYIQGALFYEYDACNTHAHGLMTDPVSGSQCRYFYGIATDGVRTPPDGGSFSGGIGEGVETPSCQPFSQTVAFPYFIPCPTTEDDALMRYYQGDATLTE